MTSTVDPPELLLVALRAARAAGAELLRAQEARRAGDELTVQTKTSRTDPVTEADRRAERTIVEQILRSRPDDGIVGEEDQGDRPGSSGLRWIIDPLDGTVNFVHHVPQWSVSVAVVDEQGPLVGVVFHPELGEAFHALRGGGAWHAERRLRVLDPSSLDEVMLTTGFAYEPDLRAGQLVTFRRWATHVRYLRRFGSAALDLAWVAAGRGHVYVEAGLEQWDHAAGSLIVTEAGGRVSHVEVPYPTGPRSTVVASGPTIHDRLVEMVTDEHATGDTLS